MKEYTNKLQSKELPTIKLKAKERNKQLITPTIIRHVLFSKPPTAK